MANNKSNPTHKNRHYIKGVLSILLGVLILLGLAYMLVVYGGDMSEQRKMEKYLENKYNKEFIVGKPVRKASGLGIEGYLQAIAHPKENDKLDFTIQESSSFISDGYPGVVWKSEETERLVPIVSEIFSKHVNFQLDILNTGTTRGNIDIKGSVPVFADAKKIYGKKILYTIIFKDDRLPTLEDKIEIANNILDFKQYIPIEDVDIIVDYFMRTSGDRRYGLSISGNDLRKIESADEILRKTKYFIGE